MMKIVKNLKSKAEKNKIDKENKIIDSAYKLFMEKGINNTSIQDIVNEAGVAKGTFYLYFKDKYKLQETLIIRKSYKLFHNALDNLNPDIIKNFDDQIIFVIDYVIDELAKAPDLLKIIYKDLALGFYKNGFSSILDDDQLGIYEIFKKGIEENKLEIERPDITLCMIIELVGATCFSSIINNKPLPIDEYKPYLYKTIRLILNEKN